MRGGRPDRRRRRRRDAQEVRAGSGEGTGQDRRLRLRLSRDPAARRRLAALGACAGVALVAGLALGGAAGDGDRAGSSPARQGTTPASGLSLRRQVGQVIVSSFDETELPDYIRRRLRAGETAGVILFGRNMESEAGLRRMTEAIQRASGGGALVAADQEGGLIRTVPFAGPVPGQSEQADPGEARSLARGAARELRGLGVNLNLAPVADVVTPGGALASRSFPGSPEEVGELVAASGRGMAEERVAATAKHFPGLGAATANTDDAPVTIEGERAELEARDLPPFSAAIEAGTPLVMASHALYPAYDPADIASQSDAVLEDLLRRRLRFRGVVVTDSMEAEAVLSRSGVADSSERSIEAGADLLLLTGSGSWNEVFPRLLERARTTPSFRERVAEAAGRVLALKRRLGLRPPR
ncbi:MAG TPA: glycoside hydrolase family 3 N-terminal domain-containing protein [Thermoleophilaceae bacterium]|nr:glycoside hydrolase family 3 N-terminal domain-containing protein [Thermoleophilaceae bacterium]